MGKAAGRRCCYNANNENTNTRHKYKHKYKHIYKYKYKYINNTNTTCSGTLANRISVEWLKQLADDASVSNNNHLMFGSIDQLPIISVNYFAPLFLLIICPTISIDYFSYYFY